jgi:hypothetical protein
MRTFGFLSGLLVLIPLACNNQSSLSTQQGSSLAAIGDGKFLVLDPLNPVLKPNAALRAILTTLGTKESFSFQPVLDSGRNQFYVLVEESTGSTLNGIPGFRSSDIHFRLTQNTSTLYLAGQAHPVEVGYTSGDHEVFAFCTDNFSNVCDVSYTAPVVNAASSVTTKSYFDLTLSKPAT